MHTDNLSSSLQYIHVILWRSVIAKVCFSALQNMGEEVSFHIFFKKMSPNYLEKEKFQVIMRKKKLKLRNTTTIFFIK